MALPPPIFWVDKTYQKCYNIPRSVRLQVMLLFAIPVCDLCKATAQHGKETDGRWWRTIGVYREMKVRNCTFPK